MKFYLSILAYLMMAVVLGWGIIVLMAKGNPWVLVAGVVVYLIALVKFGCLPDEGSH